MEERLGYFTRHQGEEIWICLRDEGASSQVELRAYERRAAAKGELTPGKEKLAIPLDLLPTLVKALTEAQGVLAGRGLLYAPSPAATTHMERGELFALRTENRPPMQAARKYPRVTLKIRGECRLLDKQDFWPGKPLVGEVLNGMQRKARGSATVRMLDALGAISGNLGVPGGGVSFYFKRRGAFDTSFVKGEAVAPRTLGEPRLGREILDASDPAIRMVWVTAGNPVAMLPESETVRRALESRELTVVVDAFLTDTALAAHVVLPTTTMLEDDDLVGAYGHHHLGEVRPVAARPGDVRTDHEIVQALAWRVGLGAAFEEGAEAWKRRILSKSAARGVTLESLREGYPRKPFAAKVLFADRKFGTTSGKVNLIRDVEVEPERPTAERPMRHGASALRSDAARSRCPSGGIGTPCPALYPPAAAPSRGDGRLPGGLAYQRTGSEPR